MNFKAVSGVFLILFLLVATSVMASPDPGPFSWSTTDGNLNIYLVDDNNPPDQYAIFDPTLSTKLFDLQAGGNSIDIDSSTCFDFAWLNNGTWDNSYDVTPLNPTTGNDMYALVWPGNFGSADNFVVIDAKPQCNPVPIPAAGYLLLAGMAGLISTRKIRK